MALPDEITVLLEETETIFLLDMPSITIEKGTEHGDNAEKDNEVYEYLTVGKGKNRKRISTETQTYKYILKTRSTMVPIIEHKSSYAFASAWDMYDSFLNYEKEKLSTDDRGEFANNNKRNNDVIDEETTLSTLCKNITFINSVTVMERILANNVYNKQQEIFKDISEQNGKGDLDLKYLWSFVCNETKNRAVTTMCWNPQNGDIMAVGYGKYFYTQKTNGVVAIWNIKNPTQPERLFTFDFPVTSVAFSENKPYLLAVGFYNGDILILNIGTNDKNIIVKSSRTICPSYEPIWEVTWYKIEEEEESIITAGQDGRINKFMFTKMHDFVCNQIMRIHRTHGSIKGEPESNASEIQDIPILRYSMCLLLCYHPTIKDVYFVGTTDGCVFKCSVNCSDEYVDVFMAHDGPIYGMEFSPFRKNIFVTCGADWLVKVWIENVVEPLIVLNNSLDAVKSVSFCPTHSTIIGANNNQCVYVWDLKNNNQMLIKEMRIESDDSVLTNLKFTKDGKNMVIADTVGDVHVYNLSNMDKPRDDDEGAVLDGALDHILLIKPDLKKKVDQIKKSI